MSTAQRKGRSAPARIKKTHQDLVRQKIRGTLLILRLQKFVMGKIEMDRTQVTAALGLLNKVLPDLKALEVSGEVESRSYVVAPEEAKTIEAWQAKHAPKPSTIEHQAPKAVQ